MAIVEGKIAPQRRPPAVQPDNEIGSQWPLLQFSGLTLDQYADLDVWLGVIPDEILIGSLGDARLRVQSPIPIKFRPEGQQFTAEAVEFNEFGFGANRSEALRDLQLAIVELFFTLEKEQDCLRPDLQNIWACLQDKIHKQ